MNRIYLIEARFGDGDWQLLTVNDDRPVVFTNFKEAEKERDFIKSSAGLKNAELRVVDYRRVPAVLVRCPECNCRFRTGQGWSSSDGEQFCSLVCNEKHWGGETDADFIFTEEDDGEAL